MCFEFLHDCKSPLLATIPSLTGNDNFFIVSIGQLHYLYIDETKSAERVTRLLLNNSIQLFRLPPQEMWRLLNFPVTKEYQQFFGNRLVYEAFCQTVAT